MWLDEYESLLRSPQHAFNAAAELKRQHFPHSLFKYRSFNDQNLAALDKGSVWMAPAKSLNDPYDSATQVSFATRFEDLFRAALPSYLKDQGLSERLSESDVQDILASDSATTRTLEIAFNGGRALSADLKAAPSGSIQSRMRQREGDLNRGLAESFRAQTTVCCFTADGTSTVLWAHYADTHRGYCIEYAPGDIPPTDIKLLFLCPALYRDGVYDGTDLLAALRTGPKLAFARWPILSASYKNRRWEYEHEWRIIEPYGMTPPEGMALVMPPPRAVYLGAKHEPRAQTPDSANPGSSKDPRVQNDDWIQFRCSRPRCRACRPRRCRSRRPSRRRFAPAMNSATSSPTKPSRMSRMKYVNREVCSRALRPKRLAAPQPGAQRERGAPGGRQE